jgi:capsular polysaccharide transport system permease protein
MLKAPRFHVRPPVAPSVDAKPASGELLFDNHEDGFGDMQFPTAAPPVAPAARVMKVPRAPGSPTPTAALEAIAAEGLTGRQLRAARRLAQRHNIVAASDYESVYLLRKAGIDPFARTSVLDSIGATNPAAPEPEQPAAATAPQGRSLTALPGDSVKLPQKAQPIRLPSTEDRAAINQAAEILRMQKEIARRRRRKLVLLAARLFVFVFLPTFVAGFYYFAVATPMYSTKSEFVIQQAEPPAAAGIGGLLSGTALATSQDSIAVQGYLQSRDAMLRLDKDHGFREHFRAASIDPLQRLDPDASLESAYKVYKKYVKIAYDPTEGIVKMEVIAADPKTAAAWANQLINYAEEQVDHLTQRLREDQMKGARESYEDAEVAVQEAQRRLITLQENFKVISSEVEVSLLTAQIGALDTQLTQELLSLAQMEANEDPNQARMEPVKRRIATLQDQISTLRAKLTESEGGEESLARVQGELLVAQADVQTRQMILAQSLQAMENARIEANRQVRYLSLSVSPTPPDEAAYPRAFENTLVAMLILMGIYLMVSMTAAILREQVSA